MIREVTVNALVSIGSDGHPVTTSLAIAEGVGNPHASVIRLIRENQGDLEEFGPLGFEIHVVKRPQGGGAPTEYAILNEQQATLLLTYMRNNDIVRSFKKRLVKAFFDLAYSIQDSTRPSFDPDKLSRLDILQIAMEAEKQRLQLEAQVRDARPKVRFHDQVAAAVNCHSIRDAAKIFGTGQNRFFHWLRSRGFLMNDNRPYQRFIDRGIFRVTERIYRDANGEDHVYCRTLITGRGMTYLQRIMDQEIGQPSLDLAEYEERILS